MLISSLRPVWHQVERRLSVAGEPLLYQPQGAGRSLVGQGAALALCLVGGHGHELVVQREQRAVVLR